MKLSIFLFFAFFFIEAVVYGEGSAVDDVLDGARRALSPRGSQSHTKASLEKLKEADTIKCEEDCYDAVLNKEYCKKYCKVIIGQKIADLEMERQLKEKAKNDEIAKLEETLNLRCKKNCIELTSENEKNFCKEFCDKLSKLDGLYALKESKSALLSKEQRHRIEDAVHATKKALEEGVLNKCNVLCKPIISIKERLSCGRSCDKGFLELIHTANFMRDIHAHGNPK